LHAFVMPTVAAHCFRDRPRHDMASHVPSVVAIGVDRVHPVERRIGANDREN